MSAKTKPALLGLAKCLRSDTASLVSTDSPAEAKKMDGNEGSIAGRSKVPTKVQKRYRAVVCGRLGEKCGHFETTCKGGRAAKSKYEVVAEWELPQALGTGTSWVSKLDLWPLTYAPP